MIEKINIEFENCYGIKSLKHEFDFSNKNMPVLIYSPNGSMKTSFAMTFHDHSKDIDSQDRVYPDREFKRVIIDQDNARIPQESVFVIKSYDEDYKSGNISKLLVSKNLKDEYDEIYKDIGDKKNALIKELKKVSGIKKDAEIELELASAFNQPTKKLFTAFGRVEREVKAFDNPDFAKIPYKSIFTDKIIAFLGKEDFKTTIADYSKTYEELLDKSCYFKKGIFNHNNASTIAKNLKSNGWFDSGHSVNLKTIDTSIEIKNQDELEGIVQKEKEAILTDPELKKSFEKIDDAMSNAELKSFRDYIINNQFILPELANIPAFKEKLWIAYLNATLHLFEELMTVYDHGQKRITEIIAAAKGETTTWLKVIKTFNERFSVPFIVNMDNQDDVILGLESPQISFDFQDFDDEKIRIDERKLNGVLSNGEKRALYILHIIFEVIARQETQQETVFIVDDIADSFDYKNKYAIIEYLSDIKENDIFHLVILTHNYDFYRTVKGRLGVYRPNKLHSVRSSDGISFVNDQYGANPFTTWRENLSDPRMLIASIPFIRNLAEYTDNKEEFAKLTALLHVKPGTHELTLNQLGNMYREILHESVEFTVNNPDALVTESIYALCDEMCSQDDQQAELESKVILSVGIRLRTEDFLIREINDADFVLGIGKNQTLKLIKRYKSDFKENSEIIEFIERVNLMTPENIHLNSFMYEPILDMSDVHLKGLYLSAKNYHTQDGG
jgi:hypothetical protein